MEKRLHCVKSGGELSTYFPMDQKINHQTKPMKFQAIFHGDIRAKITGKPTSCIDDTIRLTSWLKSTYPGALYKINDSCSLIFMSLLDCVHCDLLLILQYQVLGPKRNSASSPDPSRNPQA